MRRAISIVPAALAVVSALILLMGLSNNAFSAKVDSCKPRIFKDASSRSYDCNVAIEGGATDTMTLDFFDPSVGGGPEDFDVWVNGVVTGTCACVKKGKKLEKSKRFRCDMDNTSYSDNTSVGDFNILNSTIEGKPNKAGTKIKAGQGVDEDGTSILYNCVETPAP